MNFPDPFDDPVAYKTMVLNDEYLSEREKANHLRAANIKAEETRPPRPLRAAPCLHGHRPAGVYCVQVSALCPAKPMVLPLLQGVG